MAAKLHQILAALNGVTTETERVLAHISQGITVVGEQSPLSGISVTYEPRDAQGDPLPPKHQRVQIKVEHDVMPVVSQAFGRMLDIMATRDEANTHARADVKIGEQVILSQVPATHLLTLENQLGKLRGIINAFPVLDPAQEWHWDKNRSVYVTDETVRARSIPVPQVQVLYEAVVRDGVGIPAQVRPYEITKPVGDYHEVKFSGAMPAERKEIILRRLAQLQEAVKHAREQANRIDAPDQVTGAPVFDFLFAEA